MHAKDMLEKSKGNQAMMDYWKGQIKKIQDS